MYFCEDQAVFHVKLQVAVMCDIVGFVEQVGDEFLGRFPVLSSKVCGKGA